MARGHDRLREIFGSLMPDFRFIPVNIQGEKQLMLGMLERAARDVIRGPCEVQHEALEWFMSRDEKALLGFELIALEFNLKKQGIRRLIMNLNPVKLEHKLAA